MTKAILIALLLLAMMPAGAVACDCGENVPEPTVYVSRLWFPMVTS